MVVSLGVPIFRVFTVSRGMSFIIVDFFNV